MIRPMRLKSSDFIDLFGTGAEISHGHVVHGVPPGAVLAGVEMWHPVGNQPEPVPPDFVLLWDCPESATTDPLTLDITWG